MKNLKSYLAWLVALGVAVGAVLVSPKLLADMPTVVDWARRAGATGALVYAVVYVLATLLLLPGSLLTAGAGFAYGPLWGTALVSPVSVLAATFAFLLGRGAARPWVKAQIRKRGPQHSALDSLDRAIGERGFYIVLLLRLSPVIPFNFLNYALGLTRVRLRDYVIASFVGMLPGTFLYVYLGSALTSLGQLSAGGRPKSLGEQVLYWAGLGATLIVTVLLTRMARRALGQQTGKPVG